MMPIAKCVYHRCVLTCVIVILLAALLSGCWDTRRIDELTLNSGVGLDAAVQSPDKEQNPASYTDLKITFQNIVARVASGTSKGPASDKPFTNITKTGKTINTLVNAVSSETNPIIGDHVKVLLLGKKILQRIDIETLLSAVYRGVGLRESCLILVSEQDANDALHSNSNEMPTEAILNIADNQGISTRILPTLTLQKTMEKVFSNQSFIIQSITKVNGKLLFDGGAIIDGASHRYVGTLGTEHMNALTWLTAKRESGFFPILDDQGRPLFVYKISRLVSKVKPVVSGDQITFQVDIKSEGMISEDWRQLKITNDVTERNEFEKQTQQLIKQEVTRKINIVLEQLQQRFKSDVLGYGNLIHIHYPDVWRNIKDQWPERFAASKVNLNLDIKIENYGLETMDLTSVSGNATGNSK